MFLDSKKKNVSRKIMYLRNEHFAESIENMDGFHERKNGLKYEKS